MSSSSTLSTAPALLKAHILICLIIMCCLTLQTSYAYAADTDTQLRVEAAFRPMTLRGYTRAQSSATISAEVSGRIIRLNYAVGDTIDKAALLLIDDTFIKLELKNNSVALASNQVVQQQAQLRLDWLTKEFQRRQQLVQQQRISQVSFEDISQQRDQAALALQQQQLNHQQLNIQHQTLEQQLQRHQPRATAGWQVSQKYVEPGDLVQVGKPLMQVGNYQQLLIPLAVTAVELQTIRAANGSGARVAGNLVNYHIATVSPAFDENTRKINIELELVKYSGEKRGGLPFELTVKLPDSGVMLPLAAVRNRYQHPQVQTRDSQQPIAIEIVDHITGNTGKWVHIQATDELPIGTILKSSAEH